MGEAYRDKAYHNMWLTSDSPVHPGEWFICSIKGDIIAAEVDELYAKHIVELHNADVLRKRELGKQ